MNALFLHKSDDTPEVKLDPVNNIFEISSRSLPENAIEFYAPIIKWLQDYCQHPNVSTITFNFKLEYFNTASAKQIAKILLILEKLSSKLDVLIKWYYDPIDTDMLQSGKRYSKLIKINFDFIELRH